MKYHLWVVLFLSPCMIPTLAPYSNLTLTMSPLQIHSNYITTVKRLNKWSYFTIHWIDVKEPQGGFLHRPYGRSPDVDDSNVAVIFQPFLRNLFPFSIVFISMNGNLYFRCRIVDMILDQSTEESADPLDSCLIGEVCVHVVGWGVPAGQGPLRPGGGSGSGLVLSSRCWPEVVVKEHHLGHIAELVGQHLPQLGLVLLPLLWAKVVAEVDLGVVLSDHHPVSGQPQGETLRHGVWQLNLGTEHWKGHNLVNIGRPEFCPIWICTHRCHRAQLCSCPHPHQCSSSQILSCFPT